MDRIRLALLRGVCQMPAYVAHAKGMLRDVDVEATLDITPTAWMVPQRMVEGNVQFAVIPWTRVVSCNAQNMPLRVVCGSGLEEAVMVLRPGVTVEQVRRVCVPHEGGMKDLTAMALVQQFGWDEAELVRMPSGDGAILSFIGEGGDAASMVEPYATMLQDRGLGRIIKRTGDVWPGAPGCSLVTTASIIEADSDLVQRVVTAYVRAERYVRQHPDEAAAIAARFIGVKASYIRHALEQNHPDVNAIRNHKAMQRIVALMIQRGYVTEEPKAYVDFQFLDRAAADLSAPSCEPAA